jgi:putative membrane protein
MAIPRNQALRFFLLAIVAAALVVSAIGPTDRLTWWLEVLPVLIAVPLLVLTVRRCQSATGRKIVSI